MKKKWTTLKAKGDIPSPRSRSKMIAYHNKIAIIGGWNRTNHFNDWFEYNLETNCWSEKFVEFPFQGGFAQHTCVVKNNRLYIFGGHDSKEKRATEKLWGYFLGNPTAS